MIWIEYYALYITIAAATEMKCMLICAAIIPLALIKLFNIVNAHEYLTYSIVQNYDFGLNGLETNSLFDEQKKNRI